MGNRCNDCNKFVSLETEEPEEESIDVSDSAVSIEVTIRRNCSECGSEMKSATLQAETELDESWAKAHNPEGDEVEESECGAWSVESDTLTLTETGGGRYAKNMIGFVCEATVTCSCGDTTTVTLQAEEAASNFDEMQ